MGGNLKGTMLNFRASGMVMDASWSQWRQDEVQFCTDDGEVFLMVGFKLAVAFRRRESKFNRIARSPFRSELVALSDLVENQVHIYDLRRTAEPLSTIQNMHLQEITSLKWCPHDEGMLATTSVDRTLRVWTALEPTYSKWAPAILEKPQKLEDQIIGCDWNLHDRGVMALASRDHLIKIYRTDED
jgi:WD40 repeat protein